jgi:peptidoglycan lytic transglycosylase G
MSDDWLSDDAFSDPEDPASADRARRRREREERRQSRSGEAAGSEDAARYQEAFEGGGEAARTHSGPPAALSSRTLSLPGPKWLAAAVAALLAIWFLWALLQPFHGDGSGHVVVKVPKGASVSEVGDLLDDEGVVSSSTLFQIRVTIEGKRDELYPGTYTLAQGMSYGDAIDAISTPPVKRTITITIPEGLSRRQIAPLAADAGVKGDYLAASERSGDLDPAAYGGKSARSLEGFLFPATYELPAHGTAAQLVARQLDAFKQRIGGVDMSYARSKNLNIYDVLTIASMIEREVQVPAERKLVAAVIYNRLHEDMPLGIDATIRFAVNNYTQPLTESELATPSAYNTRLYSGLPPGPIGNPGIASIEAAAHPAKVDYLYYVVKPGTCGEHAFSTTAAQFERDVARYNSARAAAGGQSPTSC